MPIYIILWLGIPDNRITVYNLNDIPISEKIMQESSDCLRETTSELHSDLFTHPTQLLKMTQG